MAKVLKVKKVRDQGTKVVCVLFDEAPSPADLANALGTYPDFPWGEALPSTYFDDPNWWDVGESL